MTKGPININQTALHKPHIPEAYRNVAKGMEKQFARFMLDQMQKTVDTASPDSTATNYYKSMTNDEYSKILSEQDGGLGIQEMILRQIVPNYNQSHLSQANKINAFSNVQKGINTTGDIHGINQ